MSDENTHDIKEKKSWYGGLLKVLFFAGAFFLVIFTVMANIGGNDEFYKESIEGYFEDLTGYEARVGTLNNIRFFPTITFDFAELDLRENAEDETPVAFVELFQFRMGFWDVALSTGKIKQLYVENFQALPGTFTGKSLTLEKLTIEEKPLEGKAFLLAQGSIGQKALNAVMDMKVFGVGKAKRYRFGDERGLDISLGDISAAAHLKNQIFDDLDVRIADKPVLTGRLSLNRKGTGVDIDGEIILADHGSDWAADLSYKGGAVNGSIKGTALHVEDVKQGGALRALVDELEDIIGQYPVVQISVALSFDDVLSANVSRGALQGELQIEEAVLGLGIDGEFQSVDQLIESYTNQ